MIRVLVVEDNADDAFILDLALGRSAEPAFELVRAERVRDAEGLLRSGAGFDVVLTDLHLPDSAGLQAVAQLASAAGETPIVVLSGSEDPRLREQLLTGGAKAFWSKDRMMDPELPRMIARVARA